MKCSVCQSLLTGRQIKFCSIKCHNADGNNKYQIYQKQQAKGLKRKKELISLKGGKCESCGYNKNLAALSFHHVNPLLKEHNLDLRKLSNCRWEWCLIEAQKCKLLCCNCHAEHHNPQMANI